MGKHDPGTDWCQDIIESVAVIPVYVTGLGPVIVRHGSVHVSFTSEQCRVDGNGMENVLVSRLVIPSEIFGMIIDKVADQFSVLMKQMVPVMN